MIVLLLGPPGSGKGTQAKKIAHQTGWPHLSTGDMLRQAMSLQTPVGLEVQALVNAGALVSDALVLELVQQRIKNADCQSGFILDGFPRNLAQGLVFEETLKTQKRVLNRVLYFKIQDSDLLNRLSGRRVCSQCHTLYHLDTASPRQSGICDLCQGALVQRSDDQVSVIQTRLTTYHAQTEPLVQFYERQGQLISFDAKMAPDQLFQAVWTCLG